MIETLSDLVRINSINPEWSGPGEAAVADYVRDFFAHAGIATCEREVLPGRRNVVARLPGRDSTRRIVLEVHMDTVSVESMSIAPFEAEIRGGRMYGRGTCDVKAGLAAMMHALREVHRSGSTPPCEVWLAAVVDEEHAYRGVLDLVAHLDNGIPTGAAVVAEPTQCRVVRANKGVLRFHIETCGVAAHSSRPELGKNAITAMARVIEAIENDRNALEKKLHPLVGAPSCNIGLIEGGAQVNFVPDRCRITIDRRMIPGETGEQVAAHYQRLLDEVSAHHPDAEIDARLLPPHLCDEAMETSADSEVVCVAESVAGELGLPTASIGVPFGCDVTKLSRAGIPGVIFGPGSIEQAHADVEFVDLEQVEMAFDFYRRFLMQFGR